MTANIHFSKEQLFALIKEKIQEKNPNIIVEGMSEEIDWVDQYFEGVKVLVELG